ncbi:oligosaccharyltransferase alpha subunit [Ophiocordyceps camponoti-floridani]|uniref:Dolichyl-diphosphooligosaccharide--protein glycosyltransferase subunit 1 n=1 Tax=Ophiocordyceps camponoti-floridani TaxID=2030778 RepID=A0A8H4QBX3_9HYPO|nr:oligosaccharyltransferase alpha subunit [Ophiocordyceps camponoti-floridani]
MKPPSSASALLGLVALAFGSSVPAPSSSSSADATFKPPAVFRNANLVHVISLEKNYVKEQINVLVENVSDQPQSDYHVPFTADQMARVGGFEVKDRKDVDAGPFSVEPVEVDPHSDVQYYRIRLPAPLRPGGQQTLGISFYYLKAYTPLPASIKQEDQQYLAYSFSAYAPSAYPTMKQKTEVKAPSPSIADYTKISGQEFKTSHPQKQGSNLRYGPFEGEIPAGAVLPVQVRFDFTKPVTHVSSLERDVHVSHWGGNMAFEERYTLHHRGANLSVPFNRVKWAQSQYFNPSSMALKEMRFSLQAGSADAYFTDIIGNVSTSKFRTGKREALLELTPRYPVFGGWTYPFTIGWNINSGKLLRRTASGGYVLKVPFMEGPRQSEGVEYERITVRVLLPEGSSDVKVFTGIPESSITDLSVDVQKTYLDTMGRTVVTIKARNLVDEFRDRDLIVSYDAATAAALRKPLIVFSSMLALFAAAWAVSKVEVGFSKA